MTRSILILTSKTGGGHVSLAEALRDQLLSHSQSSQDHHASEDYKIDIIDPQATFFHWHYRLVSRYALWLWSAEFKFTDTPGRALIAHRIFTSLVRRTLKATIEHLQPDMVITTYPFLTYEVMETLKQLHRPTPFVMLFTDPNSVHSSWLTEKRATLTLAPTRETYQQAIAAGFPQERIIQVGWPVREQFTHARAEKRDEMLRRLGLNPAHFTIFLQGGGEGAAQFSRTIERILHIDPQLQIILATGTNKELQQRFAAVHNVYTLPFTKDIAQYMAAADVIMGKAGPNTLFEAITLDKPFIATAYIPGQEEANLEFIQRYKLGWIALQADEQIQLLTRLLKDRSELAQTKEAVMAYQEWNNIHTDLIRTLLKELL